MGPGLGSLETGKVGTKSFISQLRTVSPDSPSRRSRGSDVCLGDTDMKVRVEKTRERRWLSGSKRHTVGPHFEGTEGPTFSQPIGSQTTRPEISTSSLWPVVGYLGFHLSLRSLERLQPRTVRSRARDQLVFLRPETEMNGEK